MKHLKKIATCIWNFVNIHSRKDEDLKRGGFCVKLLKKIPKYIQNLWISIPEKRRIFCEALVENSQVYSKFVNIYSRKEEDSLWSPQRKFLSVFRICEYLFRKRGRFFVKCLKKIPKCTQNLWISIPKRRRNIMYYYYIYSLRVWGRVFFSSPLFVAITWWQ